jgi:hypothetical protein
LVIATTIPITTKTTIATCIQIQVGDMQEKPTAMSAGFTGDSESDPF